jgi:RNA polymerase sigma factor (sigma-70 family)
LTPEITSQFTDYFHQVMVIARKMAKRLGDHVDIEDLYQEGCLGLIDAANKFDVNRGIAFGTYANIRVSGAMLDAVRSWDWSTKSLREDGIAVEQMSIEIMTGDSDIKSLWQSYLPSSYEIAEYRIDIMSAFECLDHQARDVLTAYYIKGESSRKVGKSNGVSKTWVMKIIETSIRDMRNWVK